MLACQAAAAAGFNPNRRRLAVGGISLLAVTGLHLTHTALQRNWLGPRCAMPSLPGRTEGRDRPPTAISPSILSSDFARLAEECKRMVELGADWLHVDVMDGHFVPNLTLGACVVKSLRKHTDAFLDVHLMVSNPGQWIKDFAAAGANMYTFHLEAAAGGDAALADAAAAPGGLPAVHELVAAVKAAGMLCGLTVKPATPVELLLPYIADIDMVLIMTVEPGFGGQSFMPAMMEKVRFLRSRYPDLHIEVDGGLAPDTIQAAAEAGANAIVAGSAIFGAPDPGEVIRKLREAVDAAATAAAGGAAPPDGQSISHMSSAELQRVP